MLKKYARRVLLPLLFSFCCVFSGFLNVNASASSIVVDYSFDYDLKANAFFGFYSDIYFDDNGNVIGEGSMGLGGQNKVADEHVPYILGLPSVSNAFQTVYDPSEIESFVVLPDMYNYILYSSYVGSGNVKTTFRPDNVTVSYNDGTRQSFDIIDLTVLDYNVADFSGFNFYCYVDFIQSGIDLVVLTDSDGGSFGSNLSIWYKIIPIPKDSTEEQIQSIISAINNQTTTLDGSIGQAADDIQQSIEDQFSGEPEEEFNIDDVVTEHTEKMGVLSFGSDVMVQFLDMFQSANAGTAELTLPGFNITVQNVEYQVWPDYSFNFNQIDTWVPGLMSIIRVILPAFVWLKVLGYCITVFEKNFLSNNGG